MSPLTREAYEFRRLLDREDCPLVVTIPAESLRRLVDDALYDEPYEEMTPERRAEYERRPDDGSFSEQEGRWYR